jgi:hypothetical protein
MRGLFYGLVALACAAAAAEAARPDPASDCGSLMVGASVRTCRLADQPPRTTPLDRRVVDPATLLKEGLIR